MRDRLENHMAARDARRFVACVARMLPRDGSVIERNGYLKVHHA
jgi:hypothetical protein